MKALVAEGRNLPQFEDALCGRKPREEKRLGIEIMAPIL